MAQKQGVGGHTLCVIMTQCVRKSICDVTVIKQVNDDN